MSLLIQNVIAALPKDGGGYEQMKTDVYITDGKIAAIGTAPAGAPADEVLDGGGKLLIPGLVNSHTHAYMTIFRNYADDLKFHDWLFGKILPLEDKLSVEDCRWGALLAMMEMLRSGTTCFLDMYPITEVYAEALKDSGMRAVLGRGLTGGADDPGGGARRLAEAKTEIARWSGTERLSFMLAPHAPYSCDPGYQREIAALAAELDMGIHTHIAESRREVEEIHEKYGCTPVEMMDQSGLIGPRTVAAHCVHLTQSDIAILAERGASVATNPVSNLKLANGIAPVPDLLAAGVNVAIGTDGAASNNSLNMIREMGYAALLHKGVTGDPEAVTASEALTMATANGAKALGLASEIGKLEVGMRADLTLVDLSAPNMQPVNSPIASLCYSAWGGEVSAVMVDGRILYRDGAFLTIDRERVLYEVEKVCEKIGMR